MSLFQNLLIICILVLISSFFSISEIALAGARRIKLKLLAESGDNRANKILHLQENSAEFFATSQIGLNAVAILGGIVGESALRPYFIDLISPFYQGKMLDNIGFIMSFLFVTLLFILFADLIPKRIGMINPERVALAVIEPVLLSIKLFKPLAWIINGLANLIFRIFKINMVREENITFDDVSAVVDAGAQAGVLLKQEHHFIENVLSLKNVTCPLA